MISRNSWEKYFIIMMPWWARWRLKSPASRSFVQPFFQAQIKGNIKAPHHLPLWGESTGDRWIPLKKVRKCGKCFHLMTSSSKLKGSDYICISPSAHLDRLVLHPNTYKQYMWLKLPLLFRLCEVITSIDSSRTKFLNDKIKMLSQTSK